MYEMKPEYYTGVDFIDQEHARLFELAEETHELLYDSLLVDKSDKIVELISELINYTRTHFTHEEEYQKSINYPYITQHAAQHRQFEDRLSEIDLSSISNDYDEQDKTVQEILDFLIDWLINHIMRVDMKYVNK
jgi:hemerythrin-like metal-binding domain